MGRRVFKWAQHWDDDEGESGDWVTDVLEKYVYDGWNVVLVLDDDNVTQRKYTWGLDLSQTVHGAAGIGGLLASVETQGTTSETDDQRYWFTYDASGNVGQVLEFVASTSAVTLAAHYEYDPYGNVIVANDVDNSGIVNTNPFRFSTKWLDVETGLYYYGIRYLRPDWGRWISRDPIEEDGGLNLYGSMRNDPVNQIDADGRKSRISLNGCIITVSVNIGIYGPYASANLANTIAQSVESHWNAHVTKKGCACSDPGCCKVAVKAKVTYYANASHWWNVPEDNQVKIIARISASLPVPRGPFGGTFQLDSYGQWYEIIGDDWMYAHETGHIMGLNDDYSWLFGVPNLGHQGHMMAEWSGQVVQHEIDGIVKGTKCPRACCCRRSYQLPIGATHASACEL